MVEVWAVIDSNDPVSLFYLLKICVSTTHSMRMTVTVSPSLLSVCLIDADATIGWLLDEHPPDWCDRQLVRCYNPPHTPTSPFTQQNSAQTVSVNGMLCFPLKQNQRLTSKLLTLGFIQQASWHRQQIDAVGPVMKRDFSPQKTFWWWIQVATEPLGNGISEQLSAHFKVHACCCCIWTLTKQPCFVGSNTAETIQIILCVSGPMNS